ncbi:oligopeptidase B [Nitzschia inconspicua]|uniref:Prolyl endopeptidase-like n=1 Tax=Nitzschia inconspicua TaxID=303405 RepID=A0A9K3KTV0_9STRA|nr:oligopeptidase B [Nitzschia inconspicua]
MHRRNAASGGSNQLRSMLRLCQLPLLPIPSCVKTSSSMTSNLLNVKRELYFCRHLSNDTTTTTGKDEWDHYRQPITKELWHELSRDLAETRNWEASASKIYQEMYNEIQQNVKEFWEDQPPIPEYGPTGKWMYQLVVCKDDNTRVYQRFPAGEDLRNPQPVARFEPDEEILSMSLTPDEKCIASLVQKPSACVELRIHNIDSDREISLSGPLVHQDDHRTAADDHLVMDDVVSLEWGPPIVKGDNDVIAQTLYVVTADNQGRPFQAGCWRIDPVSMTPMGYLIQLYQSSDPAVIVDVQRTKGCQYIVIQALTKRSNEIYLCRDPSLPMVLVKARTDGLLYHLDVGKNKDVVMLMSNEKHNNGNYRLLETSIESLPLLHENGLRMLSEADDAEFFIEDMDLFQDFLVLYERSTRDGMQRMRIRQRDCESQYSCNANNDKFIDAATIDSGKGLVKLTPSGNIHFEASTLRVQLESPILPGNLYEYSFTGDRWKKISQTVASDDEDVDLYTREVVYAQSRDGTEVPISLFFDTVKWRDSTVAGPVVLVGYGAYGEPASLGYDPALSALVKKGAMVAFAHTRGGGDLGKGWYFAGRREHKLQSIEDFEACAFYLQTHFEERKLTCKAFSAGGVLVGAVLNRNPGLFDKVVLTNAFLDVHATMKNSSLFLTEHEFDEFGDPNRDQKMDEIIRSYCPVYNLHPGSQTLAKTKVLVIGTLDDPNVPYWNTTVYFKKLKKAYGCSQQNSKAFLHLEKQGGHNISGTNRLHVWSLENAFLLDDAL